MGPLGIGWARMSRHRDHPRQRHSRIGPVLTLSGPSRMAALQHDHSRAAALSQAATLLA